MYADVYVEEEGKDMVGFVKGATDGEKAHRSHKNIFEVGVFPQHTTVANKYRSEGNHRTKPHQRVTIVPIEADSHYIEIAHKPLDSRARVKTSKTKKKLFKHVETIMFSVPLILAFHYLSSPSSFCAICQAPPSSLQNRSQFVFRVTRNHCGHTTDAARHFLDSAFRRV